MKLFSVVFALFFSTCVAASPINKIVVFGDSLSDNGNFYEYMKHQFPQDPPYFEGRFSDGPVWIEHLVAAYYPDNQKPHFFDYAVGGAGVLEEHEDSALFTLHREVDSYLLANKDKADENSLYVVWIGANNYLALPEDSDSAIQVVLSGIQKEVQRLVDKGAKNFLLVNLPDLGKTPSAYDFDATEQLSYLSTTHNSALSDYVTAMKNTYPGIQWLYFDVGAIFDDVISNPENYGFSPDKMRSTCYDIEETDTAKPGMMMQVSRIPRQLKQSKDACDGYLFFDPVHPTALAHKLLANIAIGQLEDSGVEFF